jgi:ankyrin repeat protein
MTSELDMKQRVADARAIAETSLLNVSKLLPESDPRREFWTRVYMKLVTFLKSHSVDQEHPQLKKTWGSIYDTLSVKPGFNFWSALVEALRKSSSIFKKKKDEVKVEALDEIEFQIYIKMYQISFLINLEQIIDDPIETVGGSGDKPAALFWFRMFDIFTTDVHVSDFAKAFYVYTRILGINTTPNLPLLEKILVNALETDEETADIVTFNNFGTLIKRFGPFETSFQKFRTVSRSNGSAIKWYNKDPTFTSESAKVFLSQVYDEIAAGQTPEYEHLFIFRPADITQKRAFSVAVVGPERIHNYALYQMDKTQGYFESDKESDKASCFKHPDVLECVLYCVNKMVVQEDFLEDSELDCIRDLQAEWKEFDASFQSEESSTAIQMLHDYFSNFDTSVQSESYQIFLNQMWSKIKTDEEMQILENEDFFVQLPPDQKEVLIASINLHIALNAVDSKPILTFVENIILSVTSRSGQKFGGSDAPSLMSEESVVQEIDKSQYLNLRKRLAKISSTLDMHVNMKALNSYNYQDHPVVFYAVQQACRSAEWASVLDMLWVLGFDMQKTGPDKVLPIVNALKLKGPHIKVVLGHYLHIDEISLSDEKDEHSEITDELKDIPPSPIESTLRNYRYKTICTPSVVNDYFISAASIPPKINSQEDLLEVIDLSCDLIKMLQKHFHLTSFFEQGDGVMHRLAQEDCTSLNRYSDSIAMPEEIKLSPKAETSKWRYAHPYRKVLSLLIDDYTNNAVEQKRPNKLQRDDSKSRLDESGRFQKFNFQSNPFMERRTEFIDFGNFEGKSPILIAAAFGNKVLVHLLAYEFQVNCNLQDNEGNSLLHHIVNFQFKGMLLGDVWQTLDLAALIHFSKINVNLKNKHGRTALSECISRIQGSGGKAKHQAAYEDLLMLLLLHNSALSELEADSRSVLQLTLFERMQKVLYYRFLFLRISVENKNQVLVNLILKGAKEYSRPFLKIQEKGLEQKFSLKDLPRFVQYTLTWKKITFLTPENVLHLAVQTRQLEMVESILTYMSEKSSGTQATRSEELPSEEVQKIQGSEWYLPLESITIDDIGENGKTPLHYCAGSDERSSSNLDIAKLLLKHNANIIAWDEDRKTALHHACSTGQLELVNLFIENHLNPNIKERKNGFSPLHLAAMKGHWQLVEGLLRYGAQVDATCYKGHTPLKYVMQTKIDLELKRSNVDESFKQNITYTMEALLDHDASFEKAMSEDLRDAWFESTWGDLLDQLRNSTKENEDLAEERIGELMKQRAVQIIVESAFKKLVFPKLLVAFVLYLVFLLIMTTWVVNETNQDKLAAPYLRMAVHNIAVKPSFEEIGDIGEFWSWAQETFLEGVYPPDSRLGYFYRGKKLETTGYGYLYGSTKILGVPRWRQVRSKEVPCSPSDFGGALTTCFAQDVSRSIFEDKETYGTDLSWTWHSATQLKEPLLWGEYGYIPGSGYVVEFPAILNSSSRELAENLLSQLQNESWIDLKTRAVIIQFAVYSQAENQYAWVQLIVEFPLVGSATTTANVLVNRFRRYSSSEDYYVWMLEVVIFMFFLLWALHNSVRMYCFRMDYFKSFYNLCFLVNLFLYLVAMALHLKGWSVESQINWNNMQSFINLARASEFWLLERACLSLCKIVLILVWF